MNCQACGTNAQTRYVSYSQNIGALVMRFGKSIKGNMCDACVQKYFFEYTLITLFLGWWGVISFIMTPFILIGNTVSFCSRKNVIPAHIDPNAPLQPQGYPGYNAPQNYYPQPQAHSIPPAYSSLSQPEPTQPVSSPVPQADNAPDDKAQSNEKPQHWDL